MMVIVTLRNLSNNFVFKPLQPERGTAIPAWGVWNTDPQQAEGFTGAFTRAKEERNTPLNSNAPQRYQQQHQRSQEEKVIVTSLYCNLQYNRFCLQSLIFILVSGLIYRRDVALVGFDNDLHLVVYPIYTMKAKGMDSQIKEQKKEVEEQE